MTKKEFKMMYIGFLLGLALTSITFYVFTS